ncbi:MAG: hypothetical protein AAFX76_02395 [Planctomycetota bacterium]
MDRPVSLWRRVLADVDLLREAAETDAERVASVSRLRKRHGAEEVAIALELTAARRKAAVKFPGHAGRMVADRAGAEQATSLAVARYKAERFREAGVTDVVDLCCGIGGDSLGFVAEGLRVVAVDRDPVRAWMARRNAGCPAVAADAEGWATPGRALHLDPARRTGAGRVFRLAEHQPPPEIVRRLLGHHPDAAVKLSPAVDLAELREAFGGDGEVEFISEAGRLVQAVWWTGRTRRAERSATRLHDGEVYVLSGAPGEPAVTPPRRYVFAVDPAVERAGLMHQIGLPVIHSRLGLFTADDPALVPAGVRPWLTAFERLVELPFRAADPKRLRAWLRDHNAGIVEVKTRGGAVDPDPLQRRLRGSGGTPYTVFVLRHGRALRATVTRRL